MSSEAFELPAMVAEAPATRLQALPARPPTPPRGSDSPAAQNTFLKRIFSPNRPKVTPVKPAGPDSPAESFSSEKARKKVEWSAWTDYKDPPKPSLRDQPSVRVTPRPRSSSVLQKTPKSILKPYNGVIPVDNSVGNTKNSPAHTYPNFATMLESITKQLAGEDRSSRLDAYTTLANVLKAADNVPDSRALKDKTGLLMQFMQRDMVAKSPSGTYDNALINASLVLLATFLHKKVIADSLTIDFSAWVVDHSIGAFETSQYPKDITKHLMFVMAQQNFLAKVMTTERVGRLLTSLHCIENKVKGKSIISGRIQIYQKLLKQARNSFLVKTDWMRDLFTDMLSSFKDIRSLAISFGSEIALALGTERQASRAMTELFELKRNDGSFGQYYAQRLSSMIRAKQDSEYVPQIWIVVVLFLRCTPQQLEQWSFMKPWLVVLQDCFNSAESSTKLQAYHAWNKFVFAIRLEPNTAMIKMLAQPLTGQLKRKIGGRHTLHIRQCALSSVCNLLYYAFRPGATFAHLDLYWDEYVAPIVAKILVCREGLQDSTGNEIEDLEQAIAILTGLLDASRPKIWKENIAFESTTINPSVLPSLDPRWIRRNHQRVLSVLATTFEKSFIHILEAPSTRNLWQAYVNSVASAGAKEIKVSADTMTTIASVFERLHSLWIKGPRGLQTDSHKLDEDFESTYCFLIASLISSLGMLPFTEKLLALNSTNTFAVITTPSHRPGKNTGEVRSPLDHLLLFLSRSSPKGLQHNHVSRTKIFMAILEPFLQARDSRWARLEFLKEVHDLLFIKEPRVSGDKADIWNAIALLTMGFVHFNGESSSGSSGNDIQPIGIEFRVVAKVLESGLENSSSETWDNLYDKLILEVWEVAGEGGKAIAVIEPLSKAMIAIPSTEPSYALHILYKLTSEAKYPKDFQALEASRRRLWGTGGQRSYLDPYDYLYRFQVSTLQAAYDSMGPIRDMESPPSAESSCIAAVTRLVKQCPSPIAVNMFEQIQAGLAPWVCDPDRKLWMKKAQKASHFADSSDNIYRNLVGLWEYICNALQKVTTDTAVLQNLEILIRSGLESVHKCIVLNSVQTWNKTFGQQLELNYPETIVKPLQRLRHTSDILLPSFPEVEEEEFVPEFNLLNSQDFDDVPLFLASSSPAPRHSLRSTSRSDIKSSARANQIHESTPIGSRRKACERTSTPRFRYDDSQIEFAAVSSSSLSDAIGYSQVLTDRQLEVKERQATEAAAYPELRSTSARPRSARTTGLRNVEFVNNSEPERSAASCQLQPTFDEFAQSSPTPHRNDATSLIDSDVIEPPSSPPEIESGSRNPDSQWKSTAASTDYGDDIWNSTLPPIAEKPNSIPLIRAQRVESSLELGNDLPSTPIRTRAVSWNQASRSPAEVFVDAVSSPAGLSPGKAGSLWESEKVRNKVSGWHKETQRPAAESEYLDTASSSQPPVKEGRRQLSSPLSDLDEESMMRIMNEVDSADAIQTLPQPMETAEEESLAAESQEPASAAELQKKKLRGRPRKNKAVLNIPETPVAETTEAGRRPSRRLRSSLEASVDVQTPLRELRKRKIDDRNGEGVPDSQERASDKKLKTGHQLRSSIPVDLTWEEETQQSRAEEPIVINSRESSVATSTIFDQQTSNAMELSLDDTKAAYADRDVEMQESAESAEEAAERPKAVISQDQDVSVPELLNSSVSAIGPTSKTDTSPYPPHTTEAITTSAAGPTISTGAAIITSLETLLTQLKSTTLTREEATRIESVLLWDLKGALYDAEKRGRET